MRDRAVSNATRIDSRLVRSAKIKLLKLLRERAL